MWKKFNKYGGGGGGGNTQTATFRGTGGEEGQEEAQLEAELYRLQRQLHVMELDKRSYKKESCNVLQKKQAELSKLRRESEEINKVLRLAKSDKNQGTDNQDTIKLLDLTDSLDSLYNQMNVEKRRIAELDEEILEAQKQINEERKLIGSATEECIERSNTKRLRVMENRLDQALIKFNRQLATNANLRGELDHLREDKAVYDDLKKKLCKNLEETKNKINKNIVQSTVAYEERDEAQSKMLALKERSDKDMAQQEAEMKDLQRIIQHDNQLKKFMGIKVHDRADLKEEEQTKKMKGKAAGDKDSEAEKLAIKQLETAINRIRQTTKQVNVAKIINNFIKKEEENFALYSYVNELTDSILGYQEQMEKIKAEIEHFREEDIKQDLNKTEMLKEMEIKVLKYGKDITACEKRNTEVCKVLDELCFGVKALFKRAGCNPSIVSDMLGSEAGVTHKNILAYLGIIEQTTMELLQHEQYTTMKNETPVVERKEKSQPTPPVPQPVRCSPKPSVNIVAPTTDDEELTAEEVDVRPLTREELKHLVMRNMRSRPKTLRLKSSNKLKGRVTSPKAVPPAPELGTST